MSADHVYLAMAALQDADVADRAANGDWSGLGELELTDHERELVEDLIEECTAAVTGFAGAALFAATSYTSGNVSPDVIAQAAGADLGFGGALGRACRRLCRRGCRRGCRYSCRRGCRRSCRRIID